MYTGLLLLLLHSALASLTPTNSCPVGVKNAFKIIPKAKAPKIILTDLSNQICYAKMNY